jgi:YHS domain-containing protein
MTDHQLDEIMRTKQGGDQVEIRAPESGFVLVRNITLGERFLRGTELYRIADLSHVWILADIFENESTYLRPGVQVKVTHPTEHKTFHARVSNVLPQFDPATRTLKMRIEVDNPGYSLRPDMFVDVEFPITMPATLSVPSDAVLDSGIKKTVFVDRGNGFFEPRTVETGWRLGDRTEITKGLMVGERIVVSGNFLIDSESKMKMAAAGMQMASPAPVGASRVMDSVCGMEVDKTLAQEHRLAVDYGDKTYYFCTDECKGKFVKSPGSYVGRPSSAKAAVSPTAHIK